MATKKTKTLEDLLKEAGFTAVTVVNDRVIHAKVDDDKQFGKAHAAFVQTACKNPALVGASRLPMATSNDVLVVHVQAVTEEAAETAAVPEEPKA